MKDVLRPAEVANRARPSFTKGTGMARRSRSASAEDPEALRDLERKAKEIMKRFPESVNIRCDWGRGSRSSAPNSTTPASVPRAWDAEGRRDSRSNSHSPGRRSGLYQAERQAHPDRRAASAPRPGNALTMLLGPGSGAPAHARYIPLVQVTSDSVRAEDPTVYRRNRMRTPHCRVARARPTDAPASSREDPSAH